MVNVEVLYKCKNVLGEGITFSSNNNVLYWLDISNLSKLFKLNLSTDKKEIYDLPEIVTSTSVKSDSELIFCSNNGLNLYNLDTFEFKRITNIESLCL